MSNYSDSTFSEEGENTSWAKVLNNIPKKSKVLDIGCSSGNFGKELIERKGCIVDGIELDRSDFEKAKKKLRNTYQLNIETDDISKIAERYDVIYFGDVVEHLVNPVTALEKVKKLLNKNGVIVFSIPNMAHVTIRLLMLKGDFEYTETGLLDKTHLHFYNLSEVKRVFESAGYELAKLDYIQKDYPDLLIKKELEKYGLKLAPKSDFLERMRKVDAAAFQFIGVAKPRLKSKAPKKLKQFGPIDMFETFHNDIVNDLSRQIKTLAQENKKLSTDATKWRELRHNPLKFTSGKLKSKLKK